MATEELTELELAQLANGKLMSENETLRQQVAKEIKANRKWEISFYEQRNEIAQLKGSKQRADIDSLNREITRLEAILESLKTQRVAASKWLDRLHALAQEFIDKVQEED